MCWFFSLFDRFPTFLMVMTTKGSLVVATLVMFIRQQKARDLLTGIWRRRTAAENRTHHSSKARSNQQQTSWRQVKLPSQRSPASQILLKAPILPLSPPRSSPSCPRVASGQALDPRRSVRCWHQATMVLSTTSTTWTGTMHRCTILSWGQRKSSTSGAAFLPPLSSLFLFLSSSSFSTGNKFSQTKCL